MPEEGEGNTNGQQTGSTATAKTFTQDQLEAIVEQRLARERKKFADYDDLKAKVAAADQASQAQQSDMDKVMAKLAAMEDEAKKAKREALISDVASKTGLSKAKIRRLEGDTEDALLTDAAEVFDWKPKTDGAAGSDGAKGDPPPAGGEGDKGGNGSGEPPKSDDRATSGFGRPKEKLTPHPGQVDNTGGEEETDPRKLAARLPRG